MGLFDSIKSGFETVTGGIGDAFDFGGSEAAEEQSKAAAAALEAQQKEAKRARKFMRQQAEKAAGYVDESTGQATGSLQDHYGQAGGVADDTLSGQLDVYGQGNTNAMQALYGGSDQARADLQGSPNRMADLYGGGLASDFSTDPGYQFRLAEGEKAIMQSAAARGGRMGGDTLKALQEHGQNLASQEFDKYVQRRMGMAGAADQADFARNSQLAGISQQTGSQLADLASLYGGQQAGAIGNWGQSQMGLNTQLGSQLAGLYSSAGTTKANNAMGLAGQNTGLSQSMMGAYAAPVQYAGGATAAAGQGMMNALQYGGAMATMMSDRRHKTDIAIADSQVEEMLSTLEPFVYRYIDEADGAGEFLGFMAQDAEQSQLGRWLVNETPRGKMIDLRRVAIASLAAAAHERKKRIALEQRLARIERLVG